MRLDLAILSEKKKISYSDYDYVIIAANLELNVFVSSYGLLLWMKKDHD